MPDAAEMIEYRRKLYELLSTDSPALFANYSRAHANCIEAAFLNYAKQTVSILSGDFAALLRASPELVSALNDALARGVSVRVITLSGTKADVLDAMGAAEAPQKFDCRAGRVAEGASVQHYMVVDRMRYRLEEAHAMPAPTTVHAECCCNGPAKASFLRAAFDAVWAKLGGAAA